MNELAYAIDGVRNRLLIMPNVLAHFDAFRQHRAWQTEAGGQLFGTFEKATVSICHATGPYKRDLRRRRLFTPCRKHEQADVDEFFAMGMQFIGNWHTHPEGIPKPSSTDLSNTRERFTKSQHQLLAFTMIIVGNSPFPQGLSVTLVNACGHTHLAVL